MRDAAGDRWLWNRNDTRAGNAMKAVMLEKSRMRDETATPRGARSNRRGGLAQPACVSLARAVRSDPRVGCLSPGAIRDLEE